MKVPVYDLKGKAKVPITVAKAFKTPVRKDLIERAFLAERSCERQPYGSDPLAGHRTSAHYHGKRHYRYTMMNREMARMKRIHNQGFLAYTARFVPQAIKGRRAHPPKVEKVWKTKINKKERARAILSAISASANTDIVAERGHVLADVKHTPLVIDDGIESVSKTNELAKTLLLFGLEKEMERVKEKKVKAGKAKRRGRKNKRKTGPLLIIKEDRGVGKAVSNIPGFETATLKELSLTLLAPGGQPGRLCIWSKSAVEEFDKNLK